MGTEDGLDGVPITLQPEQELEPLAKTEQREFRIDADMMSRQKSSQTKIEKLCAAPGFIVGSKNGAIHEPQQVADETDTKLASAPCACDCGSMATWHVIEKCGLPVPDCEA